VGIKPPYLVKINGYTPKPPLHFWDQRMVKKKKRSGERRRDVR